MVNICVRQRPMMLCSEQHRIEYSADTLWVAFSAQKQELVKISLLHTFVYSEPFKVECTVFTFTSHSLSYVTTKLSYRALLGGSTKHDMRDSCPVIIYICLGCLRFSSGICIYIFPHLKTSAAVSVSIHALPVSISDSSHRCILCCNFTGTEAVTISQ